MGKGRSEIQEMLRLGEFPPAMQLMLACVRQQSSGDALELVEILARRETNWQDFLRFCYHHQVGPLVYRTLKHLPEGLAPDAVVSELRQHSMENAFESVRWVKEARELVDLLADRGVRATVLKGVPLSVVAYRDAAARHVGDIDLLVAEDQVEEAVKAIAAFGLTRVHPEARLTPRRFRWFVRHWKDFVFWNDRTEFEVELHWRLFDNAKAAGNRLVATEPTTVEVHGHAFSTFSGADNLIYLCGHGAADTWTYLKALVDVASLLSQLNPREQEEVFRAAEERHMLVEVSATVLLAREWLGLTAESPRLLDAQNTNTRRLVERASRNLVRANFLPRRNLSNNYDRVAFDFSICTNWTSRAEVVQRMLSRPRLWNAVDLPDQAFALYPLLNLFVLPEKFSDKTRRG